MMNRFIAGDSTPSSPEGTKMLAGAHPAFDGPVILFQNIVQILCGTVLAILLKGTFGFEPHYRGWISGVLVGINNRRLGMARTSQRFTQEALRCSRVLFGRKKEVDGRAGRIHRTIQVAPLALDPDIRLVDAPTVLGRFELRAQTAFQFRSVTLHPPPDGDVIGAQ